MKTKLITLLLVLSFCLSISAQTNNELAKKKYTQAQEAYNKGEFLNAGNLLIEVKDLLGKTNLRIQPLFIKSCFAIKHWQFAKKGITDYYELNPDKSLVEFTQIVEMEKEVDRNLKNEVWDSKNLIDHPTPTNCKDYFDKYPYGDHIKEAMAIRDKIFDDEKWEKTKQANYLQGYKQYLEKYPNGLHVNEANNGIATLEYEAYVKAQKSVSRFDCKNYLENYPNGKYTKEVQALLELSKEEDSYKDALRVKSPFYIKSYLEAYPNGRHIEELINLLGDAYITEADIYFNKGNGFYTTAKFRYQDYLRDYPKGPRADYAKSQIRECIRLDKEYYRQFN
ncbi:MAG: hypothetical protein WCG08_15085 [Paludibacter sp.]